MATAEKVKIVDTTGNKVVTIETKGSSNVLAVEIVDSDGNLIDSFNSSNYSTITTDDADGNIEYVGWALPENQNNTGSAVWRIAKLTYTSSGNPIIKFADGMDSFTKTWDSKGDYVY